MPPVRTVRTCRRSEEADDEAGVRAAPPVLAGSASWPLLLGAVVWLFVWLFVWFVELSVVVMDTLARPRLPLRRRRLGVPSVSDEDGILLLG